MTKYKQKDSFIIHHDTASIFQELTNEQAGELIKHLIFYSNSLNQNPKEPKKPSGFSSVITLLAHSFEKQLERDFWKYQTVCERNENNGKKGGRPQKLDKIKTQQNPKKADSDKDSDSDSDKDNDKEKEKDIKDTASGFSSQSSYSEIPNSLTTEESSVSQFQQFWNLYEQPKKVINWNKPNIARQKAFARFKARLKETTFEELMQNVNDYLEYKQIETSGTPKMGVDVFLGGKCFENYRAKINDICKKQGKPLPVAQKTPEKQQEEVEIKKDAQKKREGVIQHLNGEEVQFMKHIKTALKTYFDVKFHGQWIDDLVFSCRNKVAYFGFTEQKHIKVVNGSLEKFKQCVMREIATFEGLNAERIELKLID